ncbi:GNAT family N-acetyltransferase [Paenibacillus camelliae]|uniref:GNAT family N-acetyltransferase n=1 Tax=Paenibacillus camelliae TaxID=512410 RepID=UPI00203D02E7|nr:GNAT family N-acetyltransferase [Paenibacillus camelliae]MCM3632494.1 GNAT family N-acetyltransferase [Paenibacillus camelliae]
MKIVYKTDTLPHVQQVSELFRSSGIKRPYDDLERLQRMLEHADVTITAWDGYQLVGLARAITDFSYCCYLSDLAVQKEYQQNGIGRNLIRHLRDLLGDEVSLLLISAPSAIDYYPKLDFERTEKAFIIPRQA